MISFLSKIHQGASLLGTLRHVLGWRLAVRFQASASLRISQVRGGKSVICFPVLLGCDGLQELQLLQPSNLSS